MGMGLITTWLTPDVPDFSWSLKLESQFTIDSD